MHLACPVLPSIWDNCHSLFRKVGTIVTVCLDVETLVGTIAPSRIVVVCSGPKSQSIGKMESVYPEKILMQWSKFWICPTGRKFSNFSFPRPKCYCFACFSLEWPSSKVSVTENATKHDCGIESFIPNKALINGKSSKYEMRFLKSKE